MKTILLTLSVSLFCINVFSQSYDHGQIETKYRTKLEQMDKTIYTSKSFVISRHFLSTNIRYAFILVSRDVEGTIVNFYLDSLMCFYRNGQLKIIQIQDTIGTPTFTRNYDRYGDLKKECIYTYKGKIPYQSKKKASKKALEYWLKEYKDGILTNEGLVVGSKKEGLHITYDNNGNVKSSVVYSNGRKIKQSD